METLYGISVLRMNTWAKEDRRNALLDLHEICKYSVILDVAF